MIIEFPTSIIIDLSTLIKINNKIISIQIVFKLQIHILLLNFIINLINIYYMQFTILF